MGLEEEIHNLSSTHIPYYTILGVEHDATHDQIKSAYRKKILQSHPDKIQQSGSSKTVSTAQLETLHKAYKILSDLKLKSLYDEKLDNTETYFNVETVSNNLSQGVENISLDDFNVIEDDDGCSWWIDCPRCLASKGFTITEEQLINGTEQQQDNEEDGDCKLLVQCSFCTLWIVVTFREEVDDDDDDDE